MGERKEQGLQPGLEPGVEGVREVGRCGVGSSQPSTFLDYGAGVAEVGSNPDGGICAVLGRKPRCAKRLSVC